MAQSTWSYIYVLCAVAVKIHSKGINTMDANKNVVVVSENKAAETKVTATIETVAVTMDANLAKAIRSLAITDKKRTASQLATALLVQTVKGRLSQKREKAQEFYAEKWNIAAAMIGSDKMPTTLQQYVSAQIQELDDLLYELSRL